MHALISIHPRFVDLIVAGEKNLEFRRRWPTADIKTLVIYSTAPERTLAAVVEVREIFRGSKTSMWDLCRSEGGGITRAELRRYFDGLNECVALKLGKRHALAGGLPPQTVFGERFVPPQSFRYLSDSEMERLRHAMEAP